VLEDVDAEDVERLELTVDDAADVLLELLSKKVCVYASPRARARTHTHTHTVATSMHWYVCVSMRHDLYFYQLMHLIRDIHAIHLMLTNMYK
jgi:hypothetical protein